jgi:hypothetical protein
MSEPVDPIARLVACLQANFMVFGLPLLTDDQFEDIARGVITSLREPSEAMIRAGNRSEPYNLVGYCEGTIHPVVQRAWPAMIDAALGQEGDTTS